MVRPLTANSECDLHQSLSLPPWKQGCCTPNSIYLMKLVYQYFSKILRKKFAHVYGTPKLISLHVLDTAGSNPCLLPMLSALGCQLWPLLRGTTWFFWDISVVFLSWLLFPQEPLAHLLKTSTALQHSQHISILIRFRKEEAGNLFLLHGSHRYCILNYKWL